MGPALAGEWGALCRWQPGEGAPCMVEAEGSGLGEHRAETGGLQLVESPHGFSVAA